MPDLSSRTGRTESCVVRRSPILGMVQTQLPPSGNQLEFPATQSHRVPVPHSLEFRLQAVREDYPTKAGTPAGDCDVLFPRWSSAFRRSVMITRLKPELQRIASSSAPVTPN